MVQKTDFFFYQSHISKTLATYDTGKARLLSDCCVAPYQSDFLLIFMLIGILQYGNEYRRIPYTLNCKKSNKSTSVFSSRLLTFVHLAVTKIERERTKGGGTAFQPIKRRYFTAGP